MDEIVPGEGGMVGFDVELEVLVEPGSAQEAERGGGIEVVLVLGRLAGLGFDEELGLVGDLLGVVEPCGRTWPYARFRA